MKWPPPPKIDKIADIKKKGLNMTQQIAKIKMVALLKWLHLANMADICRKWPQKRW